MAYYITTPLYYVNDLPHIGHAYTTIAADIWTRARRLFRDPVRFLTGTDEHGAKVAQVASAKKLAPKEYADQVAQAFKETWQDLHIAYDDFIRTTEARHEKVVQQAFSFIASHGDIVKGAYEDWYCIPCETFLTEEEVGASRLCPSCSRAVEKLKEETYFFKLSHYQTKLLHYYQNAPDFLAPRFRAKEIESFVSRGLRDLSVSRLASRVSWGIPVPGDNAHTVYVWFDALLNYISALDYSSDNSNGSLFNGYWPATVHLVGKEIFRFHAVTWPAMLMAMGLEPPRKVFAHGWWTVEGEKMSKSRGNVVNPRQLVREVPVDALRYYLFREMSFGSDGDFSVARLRSKMDGELADNFGNLHRRLLTMIEKYFNGRLSRKGEMPLFLKLADQMEEMNRAYLELEFHRVLEFVHDGFASLNAAIDHRAPWRLFKEKNFDDLEGFLFDTAASLSLLAYLLTPVCPISCQKVLESVGLNPKPDNFGKYLRDITGIEVKTTDPLFPKTSLRA